MKKFIQASAEEDLLSQFEWYVEEGYPEIAVRFRGAVREAIKALMAMPAAGPPRPIASSQLSGLRTWPVKGFDSFRVYYLAQPDMVSVLRILHDKRDIGSILEGQEVEEPNRG